MSKTKRRIIHVVVTMIIVGLGAVCFLVLTASKPQLKRTKPPAPKPTVRVMKVKTGPQAIIIKGEGTVRPLREIQLVPQVSGKIIYISPSLVDGGAFKKGDVLLRINPLDYQLAVTLAQARVKDSVSKLRIAEEEAAAAQEEWRLFYQDKDTKDLDPPPLVAKEPPTGGCQSQVGCRSSRSSKSQIKSRTD
jgi:multidrug efflux pump subunit AcrA (membrane-fusion protein)